MFSASYFPDSFFPARYFCKIARWTYTSGLAFLDFAAADEGEAGFFAAAEANGDFIAADEGDLEF